MLVTSGKREENMLRNRLAPRRVRALASTEKGMQISQQENQKPVSSTAQDILEKNVRSWETLELIRLKVGILRTTGSTLYPGKII